MESLADRLRSSLGDRYRVEREIARGGMATVFLAEDLKHRRPVAIKVLDPDLSALLGGERFAREIELIARLQHPHILTLLDSGTGAGLFYYVMPYVEGESLRARIGRERQLGVEEVARLGAEIANALDYAHRRGVVHRDIKPENVLLADGQAMLSDFGIARAIGAAGGDQLTQSGVMLGTPPYMSPEQIAGATDLDARSDQYSLACVLYEMLAGEPPFTGPVQSLAHQHLNATPRPVTERRPNVPALLAAALDRALAKTPADRFPTAGAMAAALTSAATVPVTAVRQATGAGPATTATGRPPSKRGLVLAGVGLLVALVVGWRLGLLDPLLPRRAAEAGERRWVWLASFDGPASDPSLATAAREVVASSLDASGTLASVPPEQMRLALRNTGRPDTSRMDAELARQLAYRSNIGVVVTGRVTRLGGGYTLALQALDAENGHPLVNATGSASDERALIPSLTRLTHDLNRRLGGRPDFLRARANVVDVPTPSFEAFKLYAKGRDAINRARADLAIPLFRQAIEFDSSFAAAWSALGTAYGNSGQPDSALAAFRIALRHRDRLSDTRREEVLAKIATQSRRYDEAIRHYDALLALDPPPGERAVALNNKADVLGDVGRDAESLELLKLSAKTWPVEPPQVSYGNIVQAQFALGRADEVRALVPKLKGSIRALTLLELAFFDRAWSRGESLGVALASDPAEPGFFQALGTIAVGSVTAARGRLGKVPRVLDQADVQAGIPESAVLTWWERAYPAILADRALPDIPLHLGAKDSLALVMLRAAWVGKRAVAGRAAARKPHTEPEELATAVAEHAPAWLAYREKRWHEVIAQLSGWASEGRSLTGSPVESMRLGSRWLVARAFVETGAPDSAARYLGLMLEPPRYAAHLVVERGFYEPQVRAELAQVYARMGRIDEAQRQWETLAAMVTQPDPEMRAMLDATHSVLEASEGMRANARR